MSIEIRTFQPGDEEKQAHVYNAAAGSLPGFKPATVDEVRRRTRVKDFDPATRFFAVSGGRVVGYCAIQVNGRVGYPWCLPATQAEESLLAAALDGCRRRGIARAFSAYRSDWTAQAAFFERNGFHKAREVMNFAQSVLDLPTMVIRRGLNVTPLTEKDVPGVAALGAGVFRISADRLASFFFSNPYFPPESAFVLRRADNTPQGVGILISNVNYSSPLQVDSAAPCFRLGAFGTEDMSTKRIHGLFSFVVRNDSDSIPTALDLLSCALARIEDDTIDVLGAQVPSDAKHLLSFYQKYFRKQGGFPVFERELS
jgi:hypothetical protein